MKKPRLLIVIALLFQMTAKAQAPNITYSSQQNYILGEPITPLTPTNTGGIVPATHYGQVTTFPENGNYGPSLNSPQGVAADASGNVYVADSYNYTIRKITKDGVVTTLAGSGANGWTDGPGSTATFRAPQAVAVDISGNVYVGDFRKIRKISPDGTVTTLAGSDTAGAQDGIGSAATFDGPYGIAVDASRYVYVAEYANHKIRKISPDGVVTTLAGSGNCGETDGDGNKASFCNPSDVAVDASGNVYVVNSSNSIRKITPAGKVSTLPGSFFSNGITLDGSGNIYVTNSRDHQITKMTQAGKVTTLAGDSEGKIDGIGSDARFNTPADIAADAHGYVYIADSGNNLIRKISTLGYSIAPSLPAGLNFDNATGIISGTPTVASSSTKYTITAINLAGSSTAEIILETTLGVADFNNETISIYPNPTIALLQIKTQDNITFDKIQVIDISGKVILEQDSNGNQVNVQKLSNGIYFLNAFSENKTFRAKFIKE